jgi:cell division septal protein FtsQ
MPARRGVDERRGPAGVGRFAPSRRSLLLGVLLFVVAVGAYVVARESSVFAVRTVDVRGGTPDVQEEVRAAVAADLGRSLLRIDAGDLTRRLDAVPDVLSFRYDRSFPHTLRIAIRPEQPVLVLRRLPDAFLVSATGRVLRKLDHPRLSSLPRVWLPAKTPVVVGQQLRADDGGAAAAALGALRSGRLPQRVQTVTGGRTGLTLVLASTFQLRLGDPSDLRLKLAIARRIMVGNGVPGAAGGYLDVSVPERPVLNLNTQVASTG